MIDGLKIHVDAQELREIIQARADHHFSRVKFYEEQVGNLKAGGAESMQFTGGDPIRALTEKADQHRNRAAYFAFFATHVIEGEVYRLSDTDLRDLEISSHFFGW